MFNINFSGLISTPYNIYNPPQASLTPSSLALVGSAAAGVGTLVYYGAGLAGAPGAVDRAGVWPAHVRARVRETYSYLAASVGVTAGVVAAVLRLPLLTYAIHRWRHTDTWTWTGHSWNCPELNFP